MSVLELKSRLGNKVQGMQDPQAIQNIPPLSAGRTPLNNPSTPNVGNTVDESSDVNFNKLFPGTDESSISIVNIASQDVIESNYLALTTNAIDIINENLKNQPLSPALFDTIKAPTGGFTAFNMPGINGDEVEKELVGIILDYTTPRAYWGTPEPVEGTPPNCYSPDSIVSVDGKHCNTCVYNTFGSKDGDSQAKACKESIQVFLLRPDSIIPVIIRIPVTSKITFQKYMTRLVSRMIPLSGVVTKITLEKATSNGGQPYAKFIFEAVERLSSEEAAYAKAYGLKFSEMLGASHDVHDADDYHAVNTASSE